MTSEPLFLYCPRCERDELAETPPCADGHDVAAGQCPDRACVVCGTAVVVDAQLFSLVRPRRHVRRAA